MAVSNAQKARAVVTCKCGCNTVFSAFPVYKKGGGGLRVPEYKRGHHPSVRRTQFDKTPWNKGLTGADVGGIANQGAKGENHWNFRSELNPDFFAVDFDYVRYSNLYGKDTLRSKGNKLYAKFRRAIMDRDHYSCVDCGFVADPFEEADLLNVHHIEYVKHNADRIFDPTNVVTLCYTCHRKRHKVGK